MKDWRQSALADQKRQRSILELDRNAAIKLVEGKGEEAIGLWRKALDSGPSDCPTRPESHEPGCCPDETRATSRCGPRPFRQ